MGDWCDSIVDFNINPSLGSAATTNSPCGSSFDSERTTSIGNKMSEDAQRATEGTSRDTLYKFWKEHPTVQDNCCFTSKGHNITLDYLEELMKFSDDFFDHISGLTDSVAIGLREEVSTVCASSDNGAYPFCDLATIFPVIDLMVHLPPSKSDWTEETNMYKDAILVSFAILKQQSFPSLSINENDILAQAMNTLVDLLHGNEIETVKNVLTYLPEISTSIEEDCDLDDACLIGKIIEKARIYIEQTKSDNMINGQKLQLLNPELANYQKVFEKMEFSVLLDVLASDEQGAESIGKEMKNQLTHDFLDVQLYLENTKNLDVEIGKANIGFINSRLQFFKRKIETFLPRVEEGTAKVISLAMGQETTSATVTAGLNFAGDFNPLLALTSDHSYSVSLDSTAQLISTIAGTTELVDISTSLQALKNKAEDVNSKLTENTEFYENIKTMILDNEATEAEIKTAIAAFNEKRIDFVPRIGKDDLAASSQMYIAVVEAACENINAKECSQTPSAIKQAFATYAELHDFQLELIVVLTSFIDSLQSIDAINLLSNEFARATLMTTEIDATLLGTLTYIIYKTNTLQLINLYCNTLEYIQGGVRPVDCKGPETNIASLSANNPTVECSSETHNFYKVPTKPVFDGDTAYIDINQLYSGDWVSFRIPSSSWLVEKQWIQSYEQHDSIYVQQLETYLPTDLGEKIKVFHTLADAVVQNVIQPGGTQFINIDSSPLVYECRMGPDKMPCQLNGRKIKNPYTFCEESGVGEICGLSLPPRDRLHPSIYAQWNIRVVGAKNTTVPKPATDLDLILGMKLCKISNSLSSSPLLDMDKYVRAQYVQPCCQVGEYRPNLQARCKECPPNSYSALSGYYCESTCDECSQ